jgi:glycosyltransferase involved in cell wall biosynthesis
VKILFLSENFPPETNAAATRVFERACYWVRWGHEVTILTQAPNFPEGRIFAGYRNAWYQAEVMQGIRVVRVKTYIARNEGTVRRTLDFVSYMTMALVVGLFLRRPDVIVATSPQFFAAVGGWMLGGARRTPFVFELGDLWPASIKAVGAIGNGAVLSALEKLELFLYRRSAAVVALTPTFRDDLVARGIDGSKIAVVVNGVDLPRYGPRGRDPELDATLGTRDKFVVGYIGTLGMAHGLEHVLDAAQLLADEDVRFVFVGPGASRQALLELAAERGLGNVEFVPRQPKEAMPRYWSVCNVALVHLKNDPVFAGVIPSKLFEAMGMGLPVILAAPEGEASRIVHATGAGACVPPGDPAALASTIRDLARDKGRMNVLAQSSLAASALYSRERQASRMMQVLDHVVSGRGSRVWQALEEKQ